MARTVPESPPPRLDALAGVISGVAVLQIVRTSLLGFVSARPSSLDDAFVCLVYVRHFLSTGRIYYDASEGPLDGFTSLLDLLVKGVAVLLGPSDPIRSVWWCTLVLHVSVAVAAFTVGALLFARAGAPRIHSACGGALLGFAVAANPALAYGSSFLLETPLYSLLALSTSGVFLVLPQWASPLRLALLVVCLSALTTARPEGLPIALGVGAAALLDSRIASAPARRAAGIAFGTFLFTYFAFRMAYFGAWAPNSYYAKTSASRINELRDGIDYVAQYFHSGDGWLLFSFLPAPAACVFGRWRAPALRARCTWISLAAVVSLLTVVAAGGDCYEGGRFLAAPLCLAAVSLAAAVAGLLGPSRYAAVAALFGTVAFEMLPFLSPATEASLWRRSPVLHPLSERAFVCDRIVAEDLASLAHGGTVAQTDYQRLKYFADDLHVLDLTGLNNRDIAHRPVETPVVWGKFDVLDTIARAPEVIVLGHHVYVQPDPMSDHSLSEVLDEPRLHDRYFGYGLSSVFVEPLSKAYVTGSILVCGAYFNFLIRRDFADVARGAGARVGS